MLTNRVLSHSQPGRLTGFAETRAVHGIDPELVLQAFNQSFNLVVTLEAGDLVFSNPEDDVPFLLLDPVAGHLAASIIEGFFPFDMYAVGRDYQHAGAGWWAWRCWKKSFKSWLYTVIRFYTRAWVNTRF